MLGNMIHDVQAIAAEVIRKTGKDKPADAALREVLKQIKDLAPFDATEIAKTVFLYYRWHVWLREERGVEPAFSGQQCQHAHRRTARERRARVDGGGNGRHR
jgi:hypothetical protein